MTEEQLALAELRRSASKSFQRGAYTDESNRDRRAQPDQSAAESVALKPKNKITLTKASDLQAEPIEFLWRPYIVKGCINMLEGDPGSVRHSWP